MSLKPNNYFLLREAVHFLKQVEPSDSDGDITAEEFLATFSIVQRWLLAEAAKHNMPNKREDEINESTDAKPA